MCYTHTVISAQRFSFGKLWVVTCKIQLHRFRRSRTEVVLELSSLQEADNKNQRFFVLRSKGDCEGCPTRQHHGTHTLFIAYLWLLWGDNKFTYVFIFRQMTFSCGAENANNLIAATPESRLYVILKMVQKWRWG